MNNANSIPTHPASIFDDLMDLAKRGKELSNAGKFQQAEALADEASLMLSVAVDMEAFKDAADAASLARD